MAYLFGDILSVAWSDFSVDRPWAFLFGGIAGVALVGLADLHFKPRFGAG